MNSPVSDTPVLRHQIHIDGTARVLWPHQHRLASAAIVFSCLACVGARGQICIATGGGKTAVISKIAAYHAKTFRRRVLVVGNTWDISAQIGNDLIRHHPETQEYLSTVGSSARRHLPTLNQSAYGRIVVTTIQTWHAQACGAFYEQEFDVVICDECHWGEHAAMHSALYERYSDRAVFLGATATPNRSTSYETLDKVSSFTDLVHAGHIARPVILPTERTGVELVGKRRVLGDVGSATLGMLAMNPERNQQIVEAYVGSKEMLKKTLVFACNIAHAEQLASLFQKRGVAAQPLHSGQSTDIQAGVLADFKAGRLPVLINVAKMTHGVDVPDIRTIFLARPTTSETLFAQMIGRGARKIPGKDFFFIVDFVDNMTLHGANVIRAANVIGSVSRGAALAAHSIKAAPIEQVRHIPGYEELQGLEVQPNQTFGIEFELTCKGFELMNHGDWMHRAEIIRSALASVVPTAAAAVQSCSTPSDQKHLWAVKYDASCGFEVTSRVLVGAGGFAEVIDACRVLQDAAQTAGLSVSVKTGTHIHLAWLRDFEAVRRLYLLATYYEPAIASIISPSRVTSMYAKPLRKHLTGVLWACDLRAWPTQGLRYLGLNATSLFHSHGTIEVRWHGGTLDAGKILTWLSLWMCLLTKAQSSGPPADPRARVSSRPLCVGPRGDVNELAKFLGLKVELRDRLVARRAHLLETQWSRGPLARVAQRVSRRWNATEWSRGGRTRERRP